jgi:ATP-dependent RNA helicase DeaD
MLRAIERATRQAIEPMNLPTVDAVNALRIAKFKVRVAETIAKGEATVLRSVVEQLEAETGLPLIDIAAALASMAQGSTPLLLAGRSERPAAPPETTRPVEREHAHARERPSDRERPSERERPSDREPTEVRPRSLDAAPEAFEGARKPRAKSAGSLMETFRIEVGSVHGIKPGNIVGAIANESGIEGVHIGRVDIREDHSFVDLPEGMPNQIFKDLQKVRVVGRELRISRVSEKPPKPPRHPEGRHTGGRPTAGRPTASRSSVGRPAERESAPRGAAPRKMLSRHKAKN